MANLLTETCLHPLLRESQTEQPTLMTALMWTSLQIALGGDTMKTSSNLMCPTHRNAEINLLWIPWAMKKMGLRAGDMRNRVCFLYTLCNWWNSRKRISWMNHTAAPYPGFDEQAYLHLPHSQPFNVFGHAHKHLAPVDLVTTYTTDTWPFQSLLSGISSLQNFNL